MGGKMEAEDWGDGGMTTDWANEPAPGLGAPGPMAPAAGGVKYQVSDDWANQVPAASDWAAEATAPAPEAASIKCLMTGLTKCLPLLIGLLKLLLQLPRLQQLQPLANGADHPIGIKKLFLSKPLYLSKTM